MKRIIAVFVLCFAIVLSGCAQASNSDNQSNTTSDNQGKTATSPQSEENNEKDSYVENKEMTIEFSFGTKTGKYTGPLNDNGMPEGKGTFSTKNAEGIPWTYTGDFVNGHFEGEGEASWPEQNYKEIGHYSNDVIQPLDSSLVPKVYQNPDDYIFYCIEVSGKVYNIAGKNTLQMYEDLESSYGGNNTIVHYDSSVYSIEEGDFIRITAIVLGEYQYKNVLGNTMTALELKAKEVEETTYIEAAYPTIRSIDIHESQTQSGYSITIERIEFAEKETRVYFSAENGGKSKMSINSWNIEAEQNNRQYETQRRYDLNYPQLPDGIRVGNIADGVISFPPLAQSDFKVYITVSTDDYTEKIEEMVFSLSVPPID